MAALAITRESDLVEDAIHDAFAHLILRKRRINAPKTYAFRCVRNAALEILRRCRRSGEPGSAIPLAQALHHTTISSLFVEVGESHAEVIGALEDLDASVRDIIVLHIFSDLKFREISEVLGKPMGTVVSNYRRGIEKIRRALETKKPELKNDDPESMLGELETRKPSQRLDERISELTLTKSPQTKYFSSTQRAILLHAGVVLLAFAVGFVAGKSRESDRSKQPMAGLSSAQSTNATKLTDAEPSAAIQRSIRVPTIPVKDRNEPQRLSLEQYRELMNIAKVAHVGRKDHGDTKSAALMFFDIKDVTSLSDHIYH